MPALSSLLGAKLAGASRLVILGVGSTLRADDAVGMKVLEALQAALDPRLYPELLFCPGETAPENFSGKIQAFAPSHLLVIDAAQLGLPPGSIQEIDPGRIGGPTFCSHLLPLRVMLDYLAQETGARVLLLGVQSQSLAFDGAMTAQVAESAALLTDRIRDFILEQWGDRSDDRKHDGTHNGPNSASL